ncbi:MAG: membrane protein insertion efficiency factor YidD [Micrococcales bacterium]|nr:membrane protein insertion efficiency factor YidD [Micrococcales bacterium]
MKITRNGLLAAPLLLVVRFYQLVISPLFPSSCRFYPSCSAYAMTALTRFGPVRGGWLAMRRLGRCHPWNPGGVDPVPMTWAMRHDVRPENYRPDHPFAEAPHDAASPSC